MLPRQRSLKWARAISTRAPTWRANDSLVIALEPKKCSAVTASPCDGPDAPAGAGVERAGDPSGASSPK